LKLDPNGNILWAKQAITQGQATFAQSANSAMTADFKGNAYYAGNFDDTIVFGLDTLINTVRKIGLNCTNFLAKYDPDGNIKWARQSVLKGDSSLIAANAISTDTKGNCFVTGLFADTVTIGVDTLIASKTSIRYTFLVKYDSNGNIKWAKQSTGTTEYGADGYGVENDRYGNSFITGYFADTITFGSYTLHRQALNNQGLTFITKYDSSGNVLWAEQSTNSVPGGSIGWAITTDIIGNAYLLGQFSDTVVFASDTLIGPNNGSIYSPQQSIFLVKYDPNGTVLWAKQTEVLDNNNWSPWAISIDKYNHIYLEGGAPVIVKLNLEILFYNLMILPDLMLLHLY